MGSNKTNYGELPELMAAQVDASLLLISDYDPAIGMERHGREREVLSNLVLTCLAIQAEEAQSDRRLIALGVASFLCAMTLALLLADLVWCVLVRTLVDAVLWVLATSI